MSVPDWGMVKRVRHAGPAPRRSARADLDRAGSAGKPKVSKAKGHTSGRTYTSKYRGVHQTFPTKRWEAQFRRALASAGQEHLGNPSCAWECCWAHTLNKQLAAHACSDFKTMAWAVTCVLVPAAGATASPPRWGASTMRSRRRARTTR